MQYKFSWCLVYDYLFIFVIFILLAKEKWQVLGVLPQEEQLQGKKMSLFLKTPFLIVCLAAHRKSIIDKKKKTTFMAFP